MPLTEKTPEQFTLDQAKGYGAALKIDPSLKAGSPTLAIFETNSTQHQIQLENIKLVLAFARASTAEGPDLDTFVNEFGFYRLPAQKATGQVTFSLSTVRTTEVLIAVGTVVQTKAGDIQYLVVADPSKAGFDANRNVYVITPGQTQVSVQVEALIAGQSSNVLSNQLVKFVSSGSTADAVTNPQPMTNGIDAESDESTRFRFTLFINSRSKATPAAIREAVLSLRVGLTCTISENKDANGNRKLGFALVIMDDGTGNPPQELLDEAQVAVDKVRPATVEVLVIKPTISVVTSSLNIRIDQDPKYVQAEVVAAVVAALTDYINTRQVGETLYLSSLTRIALSVPGVVSIQPNSLVINALESDKTVLPIQVVKTSNVTVGIY